MSEARLGLFKALDAAAVTVALRAFGGAIEGKRSTLSLTLMIYLDYRLRCIPPVSIEDRRSAIHTHAGPAHIGSSVALQTRTARYCVWSAGPLCLYRRIGMWRMPNQPTVSIIAIFDRNGPLHFDW